MNCYDYLLIYISSCLLLLFMVKACGCFLNKRTNNKLIFNVLIILFGGLLMTYSLYKNGTYENIIACVTIFSMASIVIYNQNPYNTILNTMICYLILIVYEIILSIIIMNYLNLDLDTFNAKAIMKSIFSTVDALCMYLTCTSKTIQSIVNKITNKRIVISTFFPIMIICLIILDAKFIFSSNNQIYIGNIIIMSSLLYLLGFSIITDYKLFKENEKTELLLNSMSKYEKIIDDNRAFKHELLNNLLILKSYKNKNSKDYINFLDELINSNNNKDIISTKNISNLPSGLKGIFYYKLYGLNTQDYKISINISKRIGNLLNKVSHKEYINLNRIISIVLDNAIEACKTSKEKYMLVDVYKEKDNICFDISNSFNATIDIDSINKKGYSTKGTNRGLGLSIVNNIIKRSNKIIMTQVINNNIFTTKIRVSL